MIPTATAREAACEEIDMLACGDGYIEGGEHSLEQFGFGFWLGFVFVIGSGSGSSSGSG